MPNLVLEYSRNVKVSDPGELLRKINMAVFAVGVFDADDIKTRAIACDHFLVGVDDDDRGFMHLKISMGPREAATETRIAKAAANALEPIARMAGVAMQVCVEILHVQVGTYQKLEIPGMSGIPR